MSSETGTERADRVDLVADAVRGVPGVADLHPGVLGEAATLLPGRRVNGVRLTDDACEVHVVLEWGTSVRGTADDIRTAVEAVVDVPVHVTIEDIAAPSGTTSTEPDTTPDPQ